MSRSKNWSDTLAISVLMWTPKMQSCLVPITFPLASWFGGYKISKHHWMERVQFGKHFTSNQCTRHALWKALGSHNVLGLLSFYYYGFCFAGFKDPILPSKKRAAPPPEMDIWKLFAFLDRSSGLLIEWLTCVVDLNVFSYCKCLKRLGQANPAF